MNRLWSFLVAFSLALLSLPALAAPEFYYNSQSYPTLDLAEAAMRLYNQGAGGADLVKCPDTPDTKILAPSTLYRYCVEMKSAAYLGRGGYYASAQHLNSTFGCTPTGTPAYPGLLQQTYPPCHKQSEQELLDAFTTWFYQAYASHCDLETPQLVGAYGQPVAYWTSAQTDPNGGPDYTLANGADGNYARGIRIRWRVCTETTVSEQVVLIAREYAYACPAGYQIRQPGDVPLAQWPKICKAFPSSKDISTSLPAPANTCPISGHPCVPGTGEKLLSEPDFEWSGNNFVRTYRSLAGFDSKSRLGERWWHSWGERLVIPASPSDSIYRYNAKGDYEEFKPVSGVTGQYRPDNTHDRYLEVQPDGRVFLTNGQLASVIYDATGRLVARQDPDSLPASLTFGYDSDGRLATVTNGLGQSLHFVYQDGYYADPANAAGWVPERLLSIQDDGGTALVSYGYDANGRMTTATRRDGIARTYVYGESSHLCVGAGSGCSASSYANLITGVISEDGTRFSDYHYDEYARVVHVTEAGGAHETSLSYATDSQTTMAVAGAPTKTYSFDGTMYRRPTTIQSAKGTVSYSYGASNAWVQVTDERGIVTRYDYDSKGYPATMTEALGLPEQRKRVTTSPSSSSSVLKIETRNAADVAVNRVERDVDSFGHETRTTVVDSATSQSRTILRSYCTLAEEGTAQCPRAYLLKSIDGPRTDVSDITTYTYRTADHASCATDPVGCPYRKGALWKITNSFGQIVEFPGFNFWNKPTSVIDINGVLTDFVYTPRGWLQASKVRGTNNASEADDLITTFDYWPTGLLKQVVYPGGSTLSFTYDGAGRLTDVVDGAGNTVHMTRDAAGEITQKQIRDSQNALAYTVSRTLNTLGELQSITDAYSHSTTFTYDALSNLEQTTDALNRVSDNDYDGLNRLSRTLQDMNGIAAETKFTYDALDNLVKVNDPKLLDTTYTYNGFSDLKQLVSPDTGTTTYTYDSAGNLASQTDARSKVANYTYDALNRLTGISYPTASTLNTTYTWDTTQAACQTGETFTAGRLAKIVDGSGNTVYCYDRFGHVVRKVQTTNAVAFTLRYTWNAAGQLTSTIYPDGAVVDYVYDTQGRVSEIGAKTSTGTRQALLTNVSYYPFGPAASWRYGSSTGRLFNRTLNQNYQPGVVQDTTAGGLSVGYEFDEVGNLKKLRDGNQSEPPQRIFGYDGLNRLTQTQDGSTSTVLEGYTYDKTGNRTSATVSGTTTTYTYPSTSHRLDQVGSSTRAYDFSGNTTSVPTGAITKNYVYGDHNRMTQYLEGTTVKMNYVYNGRGEQVQKYLGTANTYTMYDEAGHWVGDYDNGGATAPTQQAIWFGDLPVGLFTGAGASQKVFYIQPDALGTPRVVIDPTRGANGTTVWKWDLAGEAFGTTAPNQDPDGDATQFVFDLRFPGQRYDSASGLNYNYFRDYEAATGRYVESDPIGLFGGLSTFSYVLSNPLKLRDPMGLAVTCDATSCHGVCHSIVECGGDYIFVGGVYWARTIQNAAASESNVIPFPGRKKKQDACPPENGGSNWCELQQKKLLAQYAFVLHFSRTFILNDTAHIRIMVLAYIYQAESHNRDCPSFPVPLIPLPGPTGI